MLHCIACDIEERMRGNNLPRAAMLIFVRIHILLLLLFVVSSFSMGFVQAGINEDLEAIDAVIQTNKTPVRVAGEPAYNVFQGATAVLLGQKKDIMVAAGFVFFKVSLNCNCKLNTLVKWQQPQAA